MQESERRRWKTTTTRLGHRRQKEPKISSCSQAVQELENDGMALTQGAHFINNILKLVQPELATPYSRWETHSHFGKLGLGPPPNEAYLFLYPEVEEALQKEYGKRANERFSRVPVQPIYNEEDDHEN